MIKQSQLKITDLSKQISLLQKENKKLLQLKNENEFAAMNLRKNLIKEQKINEQKEIQLKQMQLRIELILESDLGINEVRDKLRRSLVQLLKETEYYKRLLNRKQRDIKKLEDQIEQKHQ